MATKHTHPVVFGRKVADCPRCQELINGAPVVRWNGSRYRADDAATFAETVAELAAHFRSHKHMSGGCGPVCTFGDA